jgi:O-antigen/teichoic acid export membrane protein
MSSTVRRVFKNSFALTFSVLLERGILFLLPWYVARVLGPEVWGEFSTAYAFVLIAATLAPWGLGGLLPRYVARDQQQVGNILINASVVGFLVSLVVIGGMGLLTHFLGYDPHVESLIYLGLLLVIIPQTEAVLFESVINGLERMEWLVMVRLPSTIIRISLSLYLLQQGYGVEVLFVLLALYYALNTLLYWLIFRRYVPTYRPTPSPSWAMMGLLFRQALPFFLIISVSETFKQIDRIFLSAFWDTTAVGIYATGIMLTQLVYMIAPAVMGAIFPGLARTYISNPARFSYLVSWLFKLLGIITFPLTLLIIALAEPLILFVFGSEYADSVIVLQITALGIIPSFLSRLLYRATLASDNERLALYVAIVGNISSLLLNLWLVPRYGVIGASLVTVGVILVNLGQNFWYVTRFTQFDFRRALWGPLFCMAVAVAGYLAVRAQGGLGVMAWLTAVLIFLTTLLLSKTIGREDLINLQLIKPSN